MKRTLKFSLDLANTDKIKRLIELRKEYLCAVNFYIKQLAKNRLYILSDKDIRGFNSKISYSFKQCAYRQAEKIWKCWRKNYKKNSNLPNFEGSLILDQRFVIFEKSNNSFDYWIRLSILKKGERISIPIKSYKYANNYFKNWVLVNGCRLKKIGKTWFLYLTFKKETPAKKEKGNNIGIDIGIKKLMVTSDKEFYGKEIESLMNKIQRKQQDSKAFKQSLRERNYYINRIAKYLPYKNLRIIVMENIKGIKKNIKKEKKIRKEFRGKFQRWTYPRLFSRIHQLCELNGVHFSTVDPAYTSQTCSNCGFVHKLNRNGEIFKCKNCGYTEDADYNASLNILNLDLTQQSKVAGKIKTGGNLVY